MEERPGPRLERVPPRWYRRQRRRARRGARRGCRARSDLRNPSCTQRDDRGATAREWSVESTQIAWRQPSPYGELTVVLTDEGVHEISLPGDDHPQGEITK